DVCASDLMRGGERVGGVWSLLLANVRPPAERAGDLAAQLGSLHAGAVRLQEILARHGAGGVRAAMAALLDYAERLVRAGIALIPDGVNSAEDALDDDGFGNGPLPIRVRLPIEREGAGDDIAGSAPQTEGGGNAVEAITIAATRYVIRCVVEALLGQSLPAGGGEMRCVTIDVPRGSIVAARPPASVAGGNVETSQRITD